MISNKGSNLKLTPCQRIVNYIGLVIFTTLGAQVYSNCGHLSECYIPMTNNKKTEFCKCLYKRYLSTGGGVILYHKKITTPPVERFHEYFSVKPKQEGM